MANRLADETSPYLLQHKDNPVDWYPWGEEAFAEAKRRDRPILLSVGYSACHWCHVMAHESFENPEIAAQMNEGFVNIKVDREERPDVDNIYMQAVQAFTGRGGWPMTVFLLPDGAPFYGGTYFPPQDYGGMPGFPRVLSAISEAYKEKRADQEHSGRQIIEHLTTLTRLPPGDELLSAELLDKACDATLSELDEDFGGFGPAPKFPQPMTLDFLMRHHRSKRTEALNAAQLTLMAMAYGGMYDQLGGGFHRYSTDAYWLVPHFEKMLYDNAQLARVYLDAYKLTGHAFYRRIVEETLDYVLREMTDRRGGFYSSQDADSEGEEGKFFVWTLAELKDVLGDDAELIAKYYNASEAGNFLHEAPGHGGGPPEAANILHVRKAPERFASENGVEAETFNALLASARERLFKAREQRIRPGRDDKVLTGWNGLMLTAFARAAFALDSERYRQAAMRNADFLLAEMRRDGRLLHSWKDGVARFNAYLDDYALLAEGLIAVYEATFEERYLREGINLADEMIDLFWDDAIGGFYDTGRDHEALIARPRHLFDNPLPSGASAAINLLLRLAVITANEDYHRRATACLRTLAPYMERAATSFGNLLCALDFYLSTPQELAVVWPADLGTQHAAPLQAVLRDAYLPHLLLVGASEGQGADLTPLLQDKAAADGKATAYLCERYVCQAPTTDPEELRQQLGLT
jgi:uncharacterized protein YyaL (SSP411 family)